MTQDLILERDGPVGTLRLNRPHKRNALSLSIWRGLPDKVAQIAADAAIKVVIVTGSPDFSAGADISEFEAAYATQESADAYCEDMAKGLDALAALAKPTIAMIHGVCIGAGSGLALACDIRLAALGSRFGVTPAKLGMSYAVTEVRRLVDAIGVSNTSDLLFSARIIGAEEAHGMGLVNRLYTPETLEAETRAFAAKIAANAPTSHRSLKTLIQMVRAGPADDQTASRKLFLDALLSEDFAEGRAAFFDKRIPQFR